MTTLIEEYIMGLKPKEKQAYDIAKKYIGSLLQVEKTNHYLQWIHEKKEKESVAS